MFLLKVLIIILTIASSLSSSLTKSKRHQTTSPSSVLSIFSDESDENSLNFKVCNVNGNESALNQLTETEVYPELEFSVYLEKNVTRRYTIKIENPTPMTIYMTSVCRPTTTKLTLIWNFFYNKKINFGNFLRENINETKLIEFKCLPPGDYDFLVTSSGENSCKWKFIVFFKQFNDNWPYLNLTKPIKIFLKNRQQKRQIILKWEKSKLDIHAINYCVSINKQNSYNNLCDAMQQTATIDQQLISTATTNQCDQFYKIEKLYRFYNYEKIINLETTRETPKIICTGFKSQQILRDFQLKQPYFIDLYAIHTKLNNFSYYLGGMHTVINRTQPILLSEDRTMVGKLNDLNGISIFSLKLKLNKSDSSPKFFQLCVVPCNGGSVDIKIMKKREKILFKKNLYKPTIIRIYSQIGIHQIGHMPNLNAWFGNRYVIRITPSTEDDMIRVNKVQLTYTTKEYFKELPILPKNTTIVEFVGARNCRSTTIAWYSSQDSRKIKYCVYVLRLSMKHRDFDNVKQMNFCEIDTKLTNHPDFQQMFCFYPEKRTELETLRIVGLIPGRQYYVHLTASLATGQSLPYESIRIKTHSKCRRSTSGSSLSIVKEQHHNQLQQQQQHQQQFNEND